MRNLLQNLYCDFIYISGKIDDVTQDIIALSQQGSRYKAIKNISGFGPILLLQLLVKLALVNNFRMVESFLHDVD